MKTTKYTTTRSCGIKKQQSASVEVLKGTGHPRVAFLFFRLFWVPKIFKLREKANVVLSRLVAQKPPPDTVLTPVRPNVQLGTFSRVNNLTSAVASIVEGQGAQVFGSAQNHSVCSSAKSPEKNSRPSVSSLGCNAEQENPAAHRFILYEARATCSEPNEL